MGAAYNRLRIPQQTAIDAMLAGATDTQAAEFAKVDRRTIFTWHKRDNFKAALDEMKRETQGRTRIRIQGLAPAAAAYLGVVFQDKNETTQNRLMAARALLELEQHTIELDDLNDRIADLERPPPKQLTVAKPIPADPAVEASRARGSVDTRAA